MAARPAAGSWSASCSPRCGTRPARWRSPSWPSPGATAGVAGLRHRRRRGGLPAHPAPRRVRVPPARERPLHHPRRRGVRAAVDLAGDPVVRRRPARPRRADHRRHHGRRRRLGRARPAGGVRPRQADPARDVPDLQRPDRRRRLDRRAPDRAAHAAAVPGHRQHRQPADEPDLDDRRDATRWSRRSATTLDDLRWFTINAMKSAFLPFDERLAIIDERHQARVRRARGRHQLNHGWSTSRPSASDAPDEVAGGARRRRGPDAGS